MTFRFGLVGHPVGHSLSPRLHEAALRSVQASGRYELVDAPTQSAFDRVLEALRQGHFHGLNVTVPHKVYAARNCDVLTSRAQRVGAVNTLWCRDGVIAGDNTDVGGLIRATRQLVTADWKPSITTVLGAGGAARAAVIAAHEMGAHTIRVYNRTPERAVTLRRTIDAPVEVASTIRAGLDGSELVYQATTQGMGWSLRSAETLELIASATAELRRLTEGAVVVDLVYSPRDTPWLRAARSLGLISDNGVEMLVHQAAQAFEVWTGRRPDVSAMRRAL